MAKVEKNKLSTDSYKGVRDFYPDDMFLENYIFDVMRETSESFGYSEYSASILEPTKLYEAKTGEEIVSGQTYTFTDRGNRSVTLRPEMTPTLARMVAAKKRQLSFPLRWYAIPNVFRYERPQRGRLREHFQLNADIFGVPEITGEIELITLAYQVMKNFGANGSNFEIRLNYAGLLDTFLQKEFSLSQDHSRSLVRIIDSMDKIKEDEFNKQIVEIIGEAGKEKLASLNESGQLKEILKKEPKFEHCRSVANGLKETGITDTSIVFDPFLVRGFDYYTGLIFEIFDTSPYNNRSLFGGGRYDNLLDIFGVESVPAVGFGMGDVTIKDFLETHGLLPEAASMTDLYICTLGADKIPFAQNLAQNLRSQGLNVAVNLTNKKTGDQIKLADKQKIPFIICVGEEEVTKGSYMIKNLETRKETRSSEDDISKVIFESLS